MNLKRLLFLLCGFVAPFGATASEIPFEATDVDGGSFRCRIVSMNPDSLILSDPDGQQKPWPFNRLESLRNLQRNPYSVPQGPRTETDPSETGTGFPGSVIAITMADGSRLVATSLTAKGETARCRFLDQEEWTFPLTSIDSVRFDVKAYVDLDAPPEDWSQLTVRAERAGDRLIVGKPGSLDGYDGIVIEIGTDTISFSVDGETLPVPRRRVFGLLLHTPPVPVTDQQKPAFSGTLTFWNGTRIALRSFEILDGESPESEKRLSWTSLSGIVGTDPLSRIDKLSFGRDDVLFLAECSPSRIEQSLLFDWETLPAGPSSPREMLRTFRVGRMGVGRQKGGLAASGMLSAIMIGQPKDARTQKIPSLPLPGLEGTVLDGASYRHGMGIPTGTALHYDVSESYSALRGVAGIDDRLRPDGRARLIIQAGEQLLCDREIRGDGSAEPIRLELPDNVRTLTLRVNFADGVLEPTLVHFGDLRLIE